MIGDGTVEIAPGATARFRLASGETIDVMFEESMGLTGHQIKVVSHRYGLLIEPGGGNNVIRVGTERSRALLAREIKKVVQERDQRKAVNK